MRSVGHVARMGTSNAYSLFGMKRVGDRRNERRQLKLQTCLQESILRISLRV